MNRTATALCRRMSFFIAVVLAVLFVAGCGGRAGDQSQTVSEKDTVKLTTANFQAEVLSSTQPVLVDFWAIWCGPCKMIAPIVAELATEFKGKIKVGKVDVDAETDLAKQYNISAIPTLLIFKDGKVVDKVVGMTDKKELQEKLSKFVPKNTTEAAKANP